MNTFPNLSLSASKLAISIEIDKLQGDNMMIQALKSPAPLNDKLQMLLDQYNDKVNPESARNGLYIVVGSGLYNAIKNYNDKL